MAAIDNIVLRVTSQSVNYDIEVDNTIPIRMDMSTVEAGKIGKVFGIGSQTFKVPGYLTANKVFNFAFDIAQDNAVGMYNSMPVTVLSNGDTILEGRLAVNECIVSEDGYASYNVQVYDQPVSLEATLGNKLIKDADWSDYNHTLTSQSIVDSWTDGLLSGSVFYPVIHQGFPNGDSSSYAAIAMGNSQSSDATISNPLTPLQLEQFLPAVKVKIRLMLYLHKVVFLILVHLLKQMTLTNYIS